MDQWLEFPYNDVFLSLKMAFIIASSVDPDEKATFYTYIVQELFPKCQDLDGLPLVWLQTLSFLLIE